MVIIKALLKDLRTLTLAALLPNLISGTFHFLKCCQLDAFLTAFFYMTSFFIFIYSFFFLGLSFRNCFVACVLHLILHLAITL